MTNDTTTHATLPCGDHIIRRDRASKWYRESEGRFYPITLREAVVLATATGSTPHLGLSGGKRFDAAVRARRIAR